MTAQAIGGRDDAAATSSSGNFSVIALLKAAFGRSTYNITQTVVPVTTASAAVVAANPNRKFLAWQVVGTQDVTVCPDVAAVAGVGMVYAAGAGAGKPGGNEKFNAGCPTDAFNCIAAATGSSLIIWEGN